MPVTVPAHQAFMVAKLRWPDRFDGVALVVGSLSPDLAYAFQPFAVVSSHSVAALLYWSLPVSVAVTWFVRRFAVEGGAYLPDLGVLRLRDYASCVGMRHRWVVTLYSAVVGAASHIGWDYFTHAGGAPRVWHGLAAEGAGGLAWYQIAQYASGIVGTLITAACAVVIGRQRLLLQWHGVPVTASPERRDVRRWWTMVSCVAAPLTILAVMAPLGTYPHVLVARGLWIGIVAASVASMVVANRSNSPRARVASGGLRAAEQAGCGQ
jgi:hypothetical protein